MTTCDPQKLVLSWDMKQRIAQGEVDESQVRQQTAHLFDMTIEQHEMFAQASNMEIVRKAEALTEHYVEWLRANRDNIDVNAQLGGGGLLNRLALVHNAADAEDELDGIIYRNEFERLGDLTTKAIDKALHPSRWKEKPLMPRGKIILEALIDAGINPFLYPCRRNGLPAEVALRGLQQGYLRVFLDHGVRLTESGERPGVAWQQKRYSFYDDDTLDQKKLVGFQQFLDGYYDRAEALYERIKTGETKLESLQPSDLCALSLIQRHLEVMDHTGWKGKELQALALIDGAPHFLQRELSLQHIRLLQPTLSIDSARWDHRIISSERAKT